MAIGERILYLRKNAGLSQEELGNKLLVSRQTVSQWETGKIIPSVDNIYRLKEVFNVSFDEIFEEQEEAVKDETPDNKYNVFLTPGDIKAATKLSFNTQLRKLITTGVVVALAVLSIFVGQAYNFLSGLIFGVLFFCVMSILISIKTSRKNEKAVSAVIAFKRYEYSIFEKYFTVTVYENDKINSFFKIDRSRITSVAENEKYLTFVYSNLLFTLKKDEDVTKKLTAQGFFNINNKRAYDIKKSSAVSVALVVASILSLFAGLICVSVVDANNMTIDMTVNMWIFYLFTPIPLASIIYGIVQQRKGYRRKKNIVAGAIVLSLLCIYGSFTFMFDDLYSNNYTFVERYESEVGIDFPDNGSIATQDLTDSENSSDDLINLYQSDVEFSPDDSAKFSKYLDKNENWLKNVPSNLMGCLPLGSVWGEYDYFLLYNYNTKEYNTLPQEPGEYKFAYFTFHESSNRVHIEEYKIMIY